MILSDVYHLSLVLFLIVFVLVATQLDCFLEPGRLKTFSPNQRFVFRKCSTFTANKNCAALQTCYLAKFCPAYHCYKLFFLRNMIYCL